MGLRGRSCSSRLLNLTGKPGLVALVASAKIHQETDSFQDLIESTSEHRKRVKGERLRSQRALCFPRTDRVVHMVTGWVGRRGNGRKTASWPFGLAPAFDRDGKERVNS